MLLESYQTKFRTLTETYNDVFDTKIQGYNASLGPFEATINMGVIQQPSPPPPTHTHQRKGRVPQCARNKLLELHRKFDDLEDQGVFARPESLGITAEYLNPSFLVKKTSGGFRLIIEFAEEGRYSNPQPSLMPDVDSTLRRIARWKYLITSDLNRFKPPSIFILTVPRWYFCCDSLLFFLSVFILWFIYYVTTYLGKSCSFCLPRVPFVNCRQFMYLVISLSVLRAGCGI